MTDKATAAIQYFRERTAFDSGNIKEFDELAIMAIATLSEQRTGHWTDTGWICQTDETLYGYGCSECGGLSFFRKFDNKILGGKWCHCCGARMVEPQESEDRHDKRRSNTDINYHK